MANVTKEPDMKGFLTQYFMQRVFNAMSDEQFAQYQDIIKNKDFIGNMKDWKDKWNLVKEVDGKWVKNDLPDPKDFKVAIKNVDANKDWEKLYKELRTAFRNIANGRDRLDPKDDKKTLEFLDAFYGFDQLFEPAKLVGDAKTQLDDEFIPFLKDHQSALHKILKEWEIFTDSEQKFSDFINDLGKGKHNTDNDVRQLLTTIIGYLQDSYYGPIIAQRLGVAEIPDFKVLSEGLENDEVDPIKLKRFKENYHLVLNPLQREKNLYQNFAPHLKTVKTAIETAKKNVDYNNTESKDFLKEKRQDKKGPIEQTISDVKDWWADHTDKYFSLHKSRLFYSDEAKAITKAIDGAKFKPTDGLDKFVESLKTIGGKVKGNIAQQHFKWFSDTITKLHGDKQMSSIFADALKNPRKLKELAAEFAIQGIKDGKKDAEIETAMEVLKTIQYGYATSNHLNAILKQDLSLFSDKNLSFNSHEGMYIAMKGVDNTLNFIIKGTAFIATTGYNIINRNIGNKFNGKIPKRAAAAFAAYQGELESQKQEKTAEKKLLDKMDREILKQARADKASTNITKLSDAKKNLKTLRADEESKKAVFDNAETNFQAADNAFESLKNTISGHNNRISQARDVKTRLKALTRAIKDIDARGAAAKPSEIAALSDMIKEVETLTAQKAKMTKEIATHAPEYRTAQAGFDAAKTTRDTAAAAYNTAKTEYNTASDAATDLDNKIEKFNDAKQRISDANSRLRKRTEDFSKWENDAQNRFIKLMAHWDFLNSGRMRTGENIFQQVLEGILPLSQKDRQSAYKARRNDTHDAFLAYYQKKYAKVA